MKKIPFFTIVFAVVFSAACDLSEKPEEDALPDQKKFDDAVKNIVETEDDFKYRADKFADLEVLRYRIPGFDKLSLNQKKLAYYLYEASHSGRDIMWDQNYKYNLTIRKTLEAILLNHSEDKNSQEFQNFLEYTKRVWFSNGIHHHYGNHKLIPEVESSYFQALIESVSDQKLPLGGKNKKEFTSFILDVIYNPNLDAKKVNKDQNIDIIANSAVNFYRGLTEEEVRTFYASHPDVDQEIPYELGLNSQLIKDENGIHEKVWKVGGMYSSAIERIVFWLEKAILVAENAEQKLALEKLVTYYQSGSIGDWIEYGKAWVADTNSLIDLVNGFVEVYNDPIGFRGSYESVVSFKDVEASERIKAIGSNAQWFEDHSSIQEEHKKKNVKGISAKVITVITESGDASPSTPIGINLPNNNWIRENVGSKSVNLGNIVHAYEKAAQASGSLEEFAYDEEEIELVKKYGDLADKLHTDMHEVIGHASGSINDGIGLPKETLKNYASTLEEARADLVGLYFILDPKLLEIGVMESLDVGKAGYMDYMRAGLIQQLKRIEPGNVIEEAHMRNRQLICKWAMEKAGSEVVQFVKKKNKTYVKIHDFEKLREVFGQLLKELQRITSEGDFEAGKALVENYGVEIDVELHQEVLSRYEKLKTASYSGFINPILEPVEKNGEIIDVKVLYPDDFIKQMLMYSEKYSFLPVNN